MTRGPKIDVLQARRASGESSLMEALSAHASRHGDRFATVLVGSDGVTLRAITFRELRNVVVRLARRLRHEFPQGSAIVLRVGNSPEYLVWFMAALAAGHRVLPTHPQLTMAELRALARLTAAAAIVTEDESVALDGAVTIPTTDSTTCSHDQVHDSLDELRGELLLHSSGSTGQPKLVVRPASALEAMGVGGAAALGLTPDDQVVMAVPMCHSYGVDLLLASIIAGATTVLLRRFDAPALASCLSRRGASVFPGVPFMYEALARLSPDRSATGLRLAISAGAPLATSVRNRVETTWGVGVHQLYGATELGSVTLAGDGDNPASVGRPLPGVSVRILDAESPGSTWPAETEGEVAVKAPTMLSCFYPCQLPPLRDGHLLTGDLGRTDADGRLYITGRAKLLIEVGGLKVNPLEVESVLNEHPGVRESLISPVALSETVNRLHAAIVPAELTDPPRPEDLRSFLKERLAPFKIPRVFEMVDQLPRTATGKLARPRASGGAH